MFLFKTGVQRGTADDTSPAVGEEFRGPLGGAMPRAVRCGGTVPIRPAGIAGHAPVQDMSLMEARVIVIEVDARADAEGSGATRV
jgi:hypothetical protein